jgi:hypothetical protein
LTRVSNKNALNTILDRKTQELETQIAYFPKIKPKTAISKSICELSYFELQIRSLKVKLNTALEIEK